MKNTLRMLLIVYAFVLGTGAFAQVTVPGVTNVLYYEPFSFNNYNGTQQYEASTLVGFFAVGASVSGPITTDNTWSGSFTKTYDATGNGDVGGLMSFSNGTKVTDVTFAGINIAGKSSLALSFGLAEIYSTYDAIPQIFVSIDGGSWIPLTATGFGTQWPTSDLPAYAGVGTFTGIILPLKDLAGNGLVGSSLSINFKQTGKYCQVDDLSVLEFTPVGSISIAGPSTFSNPAGTFDLTVTGITPSDAADKSYSWSISGTGGLIDANTGVVTVFSNGTVNIVAVAKDGSGVKSNVVSVIISGQSDPTDVEIISTSDVINSTITSAVLTASVIPSNAIQTVTWGYQTVSGIGLGLVSNGNSATITGVKYGNGIYSVWAKALGSEITGSYLVTVSGQVEPVAAVTVVGTSNAITTTKGSLVLSASVWPETAIQGVNWVKNRTSGSGDISISSSGSTATITGVDGGNGVFEVKAVSLDDLSMSYTYTITVSGQTTGGLNQVLYFQDFNYFGGETVVADANTVPGFSGSGVIVTGPVCLTPFAGGGYVKPYTTVVGTNDDFIGFWGDKVNFITISGVNIADKANLHLSFYLAQQYMSASAVPTIKISIDGGEVIQLTTTDRGTSMGTTFFNKTFTSVSMPIVDGSGNKLTGTTLTIYLSGTNAGQLDDLKVTGDEPGAAILVTGIAVAKVSSTATLTVGGTLALKATITPTDAANKVVTWSVAPGTGSASITSTTGVLTGLTLGTVTVTATATDGSGITGSLVVTVTSPPVTSISDAIEAEIALYPNPATSGFSISNAGLVKSLVVYDIVGSVASASYSNGYADVSCLAPGVYFVKITLLSGKTATKSIVKQ